MAAHNAYTDYKTESLSLTDHAQVVSDVLFFSIGEGAIVTDERGRITRVNQIALDILACSADEILGKWFPDVIIAEDQDGRQIPNIERPITEVFLTGKPVFKKMYYHCKNRVAVPVALTVAPVMLEGKPIGAIELFRDITDELQLEHAKDEFISIASHQLRTPATVVKQYLGMVLEGFVESEKQQLEMIKIAYQHNNNELDIINDLLKVAQIEAHTLTPNFIKTDVVGVLENIIAGQQPDFRKRNIKVQLSYKSRPINVYMDLLHIQMVLENIISNANKYSSAGSEVSIAILESPKAVTVRVVDQGIGIESKDIPKLFRKFSRIENAKSMASGTGLGLYWAKKLVELYNGTIKVSSVIDKGSTFSVILPGEGRP